MRTAAILLSVLIAGCATGPRAPDEISQEDSIELTYDELCEEVTEEIAQYSEESQARLLAEVSRRGLECTPVGKLRYLISTYETAELCVHEIVSMVSAPAAVPYIQVELKKRGAVCDPQKTQMAIQVYTAQQHDKALYNAAMAASTSMPTTCRSSTIGNQTYTTCN